MALDKVTGEKRVTFADQQPDTFNADRGFIERKQKQRHRTQPVGLSPTSQPLQPDFTKPIVPSVLGSASAVVGRVLDVPNAPQTAASPRKWNWLLILSLSAMVVGVVATTALVAAAFFLTPPLIPLAIGLALSAGLFVGGAVGMIVVIKRMNS